METERDKTRKILVTTSRRPTNRLRSFCRDLAYSLPNTVRINRGKMSFEALAEKALELDADRAILLDRWKGGPGKIEFFHLKEGLKLIPPLLYLKGVKLRREFETEIKRVQAIAIAVSSEKDIELQKLADALSEFLQLPKKNVQALKETRKAKRKTAFYVSRGKDSQIQLTFMLVPAWIEAGPRMRLSHLIWNVKKP